MKVSRNRCLFVFSRAGALFASRLHRQTFVGLAFVIDIDLSLAFRIGTAGFDIGDSRITYFFKGSSDDYSVSAAAHTGIFVCHKQSYRILLQ